MSVEDNLAIYNSVRAVPHEALKTIAAGRLKGMSDINPMWRIKCLTERFGMCGVGWKYVITSQKLEPGGNEEVAAFVNIDLFVKIKGLWSDAIPGTGGSSFVAAERSGLHVSDECFKMALTDAISVACKALGVGANVYWDKDRSKYDVTPPPPNVKDPDTKKPEIKAPEKAPDPKGTTATINEAQIKRLYSIASAAGRTTEDVKKQMQSKFKKTSATKLTKVEYDILCDGYEGITKKGGVK